MISLVKPIYRSFRKTWRLLPSQQRRKGLLTVFFTLIGVLFEVIGIGLVVPLIAIISDTTFISKFPKIENILVELGIDTQVKMTILFISLIALAFLVKNTYLSFLAWWQNGYIRTISEYMSKMLFKKYMKETYEFHININTSQLLRNISSEVNNFISFTLYPLMIICTEIMVLFGIGLLLISLEPVGTLVVFVIIVVAVLSFQIVTRERLIRWGLERQKYDALRLGSAREGLGGIKDTKLLGREDEFIRRYDEALSHASDIERKRATLSQLPRLWLETVGVVALMLLVLSEILQSGTTTNIVQTVGVFAAAAFRLMPSANRVLGAMQSMRYSEPAVELVSKELSSFVSQEPDEVEAQPVDFKSSIRLDSVNYLYPNSQAPSLQDINLEISHGETIGIIGPSGSGKSTLIDLILGLLQPSSGRILVDGTDIRKGLRQWQSEIGYVPQSIYLTDESLRRNIAFGLPVEDIDDTLVVDALESANLSDFVTSLPDQIETVVGERGVRLSGGQRQRVGIARALYHKPSVLVFDEATSALDNKTEAEVMNAINSLKGSRTIIIVAHRLSTIENCDRVFELEHGRLKCDVDDQALVHKAGVL